MLTNKGKSEREIARQRKNEKYRKRQSEKKYSIKVIITITLLLLLVLGCRFSFEWSVVCNKQRISHWNFVSVFMSLQYDECAWLVNSTMQPKNRYVVAIAIAVARCCCCYFTFFSSMLRMCNSKCTILRGYIDRESTRPNKQHDNIFICDADYTRQFSISLVVNGCMYVCLFFFAFILVVHSFISLLSSVHKFCAARVFFGLHIVGLMIYMDISI